MKTAKYYLASILPTVGAYRNEPKDLTTLYCKENGGILILREFGRPIGPWRDEVLHLCKFDDGSVCETGALYDGTCEKGIVQDFSSFCSDNGGQLLPTLENSFWENDYYELISTIHWCIFKDDGTACSEKYFDRYDKIHCDRVICHVEEPPHVEKWPETMCEVLGGEWVERSFYWDTIDGKPPTQRHDMCALKDTNSDFKQFAELFKHIESWRKDGFFEEYKYYIAAFDGMFDHSGTPDEDDASCREFRNFINKGVSEITSEVAKTTCGEIGGIELLQKYDEEGDMYSLCNFGDKACDILSTLDWGFKDCELTALPPLSEACKTFGGEFTSVEINWDGKATPEYYLCDFPGRMFGMNNIGYYEECTERLYYHHDCRLPGTAFPFDGPPTIQCHVAMQMTTQISIIPSTPYFERGITSWLI